MGRQIIFKYYDDGYNPANTVQLTRRLVEQDKVFATVGGLGTEPKLAVRAYLNQQKVPQALVSTGASYWALQYQEFPWTIGWQPDYIAEGRFYGLHVKANRRVRRSRSSIRTTTTARTTCTASGPRWARSMRTRISSPRRRSRRRRRRSRRR